MRPTNHNAPCRWGSLGAAAIVILATACSAPAEDRADSDDGARSAARLRSAVKQLTSADVTARLAAQRVLLDGGQPAAEAILAAARKAERPLAAQCVQLLEVMSHRTEPATVGAALAALGQLAAHRDPEVARLAIAALRPGSVAATAAAAAAMTGGGASAGGASGGAGQTSGTATAGRLFGPPFDADGARSVTVEDQGRRVELTERRDGRVTVRIIERLSDGERLKEFAGENAADLLAQSAEAFRLYLQHLGNRPPPPTALEPAAQRPGLGDANVVSSSTSVSVTVTNGRRLVRAEENGRVIEIEDNNGRDIRMRITEPGDGPEPTRTLKADDLASLRAQDPAAAADYERLTAARRPNSRR